jgi:hypothetical protein
MNAGSLGVFGSPAEALICSKAWPEHQRLMDALKGFGIEACLADFAGWGRF